MSGFLSSLSTEARAELEREVLRVVRAELARPLYVTQRNVEAVVGLPPREFLAAARSRVFPSSKVRRVVTAKTDDVVAWLETKSPRRVPCPANDTATEAQLLARVGARRVGA